MNFLPRALMKIIIQQPDGHEYLSSFFAASFLPIPILWWIDQQHWFWKHIDVSDTLAFVGPAYILSCFHPVTRYQHKHRFSFQKNCRWVLGWVGQVALDFMFTHSNKKSQQAFISPIALIWETIWSGRRQHERFQRSRMLAPWNIYSTEFA